MHNGVHVHVKDLKVSAKEDKLKRDNSSQKMNEPERNRSFLSFNPFPGYGELISYLRTLLSVLSPFAECPPAHPLIMKRDSRILQEVVVEINLERKMKSQKSKTELSEEMKQLGSVQIKVTASPTNESFSASHQSNISTAATIEAAHSKADIMSIFEDLTQDDRDSVRLLDKSWRVRYMVANQLYELCEVVGPEPTKSDLVPAYVRLLHDNEAEVRIAAAGKVTKFCWILNPKLAIPPPPGNDIQAFIDFLNDELVARSPTTDHVEGCDLCLDDFDAQLQLLNAGIN
ncbi:Serine/threonine-protein phosphatase 2A 65 kDa regulatory subunit A gamma isoform [Vitis vinifera]|uniref:Serine/threonine-protein phosphatase 2A 65 kDa regulatory subunit A gamma isoform n=1 Tax=Vitis vinifera TaxID=29760 RepID=A0A438JHD3_VITVI|nr:Serine/threonine-protein phosphatase 2A 65 kDa regulatory subunit A gamma isoform [Vitis vinifera]